MKTVVQRIRTGVLGVVAASMLTMAACAPTPETVDRWANREGSEARFIGYLQDPEVAMETRVRALEQLVNQWRYSANDFRDAVSGIQDDAQREEIVSKALPALIARYNGTYDTETTRIHTRDAFFSLRRQVKGQENIDAIDAQLIDWLKKDWTTNPCREIGGIRERQIFDEVGQAKTEEIMVSLIDGGDWDKVYCLLQNTSGVSWRKDSKPVANALMAFWDKGLVPDSFQHQVSFIDQLVTFAGIPEVRTWAFEKIRGADVPTNVRGLLVALLSRTWSDADIDGYKELLKNADVYRWEAVRALSTLKGAEGLEMAFTNLPLESDYAFWDGARRQGGFGAATKYVCESIVPIKENPADFLPVFTKWAKQSDHIYARVISINCLGQYGSAADLSTLQGLRTAAGSKEKVPFWSADEEITIATLVDRSIESINARAAAAQ